MVEFTFITHSSLTTKNPRNRGLALSVVNSHTAKHTHERRRLTNKQRKRYGHGSKSQCLCEVRQPCRIHPPSYATESPAGVRLRYSDYLEVTYGDGNDGKLINDLIFYYIKVAGPLFVWNYPDIENGRTGHRNLLIWLVLAEPAFAEATLAGLFWLMDPERTGTYPYRMLHHQNKSIAFIARSLGQSDKIQDFTLLWCVVAHLVANQVCGDWTSFEINLNGLDRIIALLGGLETLRHRNAIAYSYVQGLQKAFANRLVGAEVSLAPAKRVITLQRCRPASIQPSSLSSGSDPEELVSLAAEGRVGHDVAICLGEAVTLLGKLRSGEISGTTLETKASVEAALVDLLDGRPLMIAEYTLSVGLLIKLAVTPPFDDVRTGLWAEPKASSLMPEFREIAMAANLAELKAPVLWTCLVMLELPLNVSPTFGLRLSLLRDIVLEVSGQSPWSENRNMLARIYMDAELDVLWSNCWCKVLHPKALNSLDTKIGPLGG